MVAWDKIGDEIRRARSEGRLAMSPEKPKPKPKKAAFRRVNKKKKVAKENVEDVYGDEDEEAEDDDEEYRDDKK